MIDKEHVHTEIQDSVLVVTLNRLPVNAITLEMVAKLRDAFGLAARSDEIRCVLLRSRGKAFSAGHDLLEMRDLAGTSKRDHLLRTYNPLIVQIRRLLKPVLAVINGNVSGSGLGIALACDLRIAAEDARFVVGFTVIGLAPDSGVSLLLPALIGLGRATEHTFTNQPINADQALAMGMVNRLATPGALHDQALAWAIELANGPIHAMGLAKRAFNKAVLGNLEQALDYEAHMQEIAGKGDEHEEGVKAFLEKRQPEYSIMV